MPMPWGSMLHIPPTNYHVLAAKQKPCQTAYLLTKNIQEFSWENKDHKNGPLCRKKTREKTKGVGRRTWEEIVKWTWMRALRFQTRVCVGEGEGGETSDIPSLSSGIMFEREWDKTKLNKLWRQRADQRNFLDLGKVWKAVFWPPPGCKGRTLDSLDSWHRDQVPTSMATYHRHVEG